jgi:hypothetical protein
MSTESNKKRQKLGPSRTRTTHTTTTSSTQHSRCDNEDAESLQHQPESSLSSPLHSPRPCPPITDEDNCHVALSKYLHDGLREQLHDSSTFAQWTSRFLRLLLSESFGANGEVMERYLRFVRVVSKLERDYTWGLAREYARRWLKANMYHYVYNREKPTAYHFDPEILDATLDWCAPLPISQIPKKQRSSTSGNM